MGSLKKTRTAVKVLRRIAIVAAFLGVCAAVLWWFLRPIDPITQLQQRSRNMPTLAMANSSLAAPTNKWFSSLAFKQPSDPVFAYPLAFKTTPTGFAVSQPRIITSADGIDASFVQDVALAFGDDVKSYVRSYDDLSVEIELRSGEKVLGTARVTQGSPYIFMSLVSGTTVKLDAETVDLSGDVITLRRGGTTYELQQRSNMTTDATAKTVTATGAVVTALYLVPSGADASAFRAAANNQVTGTEVSYKVTGNKAETTFAIKTANNLPTVLGMLPQQNTPGTAVGTVQTLLGTLTFRQGNTFSFATTLQPIQTQLPVGNLPADKKAELTSMVKHDTAALSLTATDTYFGGKQLYRTAQLLQLAHQLDMQAEATSLQAALKTELTQWFDPNTGNQRHDKFFYYDTTLKGIIGEKTSFGSEDYNDHHFHYGYFLQAAAILGTYDPVFAAEYEARVTMLARDIANPNRDDTTLPYLRAFDQYAGHSWASGLSPFGSGNNQESSSEAANAWHGMYQWAELTNNDQLRTTAQWLYARETQSALAYYTNIDLTRPEFAGYNHTIISLLWGGKADYATFFDAAPESKLAIQVIPMNPGAAYLGVDRARVAQNLAQVVRETGQAPSKFKDYLIMYKSLADPQGALTDASALGDAEIDDGNSRSYLFAWLYTQAQK